MEKAILVGLETPKSKDFAISMAELAGLAEALGIMVVATVTQHLPGPTAAFYIGSGKVEELKQRIIETEANFVVFDDELSPSHIRNLEKALEAKVIDRTILILDIFARRAKSKEAMLQVELAQCEYMLPRVVGLYSSLSRQKSGTGSKGPGEQQIELDRRILKDRVAHVKAELKELVTIRRTGRERRKKEQIPTVALTGYTNAGKSSVMNSMLPFAINDNEKYVFEKDMLFATLETSTRNIVLKNNHQFLLTDTVGFISKLPHHLVEAFKSTLEEINEASLILHIVDLSNPNYIQQIEVVESVLKSLNVIDIPIVYVFNKIDLVENRDINHYHPQILVSAKTGENFEKLVEMIDEMLFQNNKMVQLVIPYDKGQILSFLHDHVTIEEEDFQADGVHVKASLDPNLIQRYQDYIK